jgi:hypothetical protein
MPMAVTHPLASTGTCPVCGVDEARLSVDDALDTVRTLGRRYREAFAGLPPELSRVRPDPSHWSMLDVVVHVRTLLERFGAALDLVLERQREQFAGLDDPARPEPSDASLEEELEGLDAAATSLAAHAQRTSMLAWDRSFVTDGVEHPARWLLERAAHEGAHHLRDLRRIRRAVAPGADD